MSLHVMTVATQLPRHASIQGALVLVLDILLLVLFMRIGSGVL